MSALTTQDSFLPTAPSGWFCTSNPPVTQLWWCPLRDQGPLKAGLLNKPPSSLRNSPLYIYGWGNTSLFIAPYRAGEQQGFSDRAFFKA